MFTYTITPTSRPVLYNKLANQIFDAGEVFCIYRDDERRPLQHYVEATQALAPGQDVWLMDHAWSFASVAQAMDHLRSSPELLARMAALMEVGAEGGDAAQSDAEATLRRVRSRLCRFAAEYVVAGAGADGSVAASGESTFYVLDELGSRFGFAAEGASPALWVQPFLWLRPGSAEAEAFSLAWPARRVEEGEEATRQRQQGLADYSDGRADGYWQQFYLLADSHASQDWHGLQHPHHKCCVHLDSPHALEPLNRRQVRSSSSAGALDPALRLTDRPAARAWLRRERAGGGARGGGVRGRHLHRRGALRRRRHGCAPPAGAARGAACAPAPASSLPRQIRLSRLRLRLRLAPLRRLRAGGLLGAGPGALARWRHGCDRRQGCARQLHVLLSRKWTGAPGEGVGGSTGSARMECVWLPGHASVSSHGTASPRQVPGLDDMTTVTAYLRELGRTLRPGGILLLATLMSSGNLRPILDLSELPGGLLQWEVRTSVCPVRPARPVRSVRFPACLRPAWS